MAIGIQNTTNVDTTDPTNYPSGAIKDDPAGVNGSPLNKRLLNDYVQFFALMLLDQGLVASGSPDIASASQYLQALKMIVNNWINITINATTIGGGSITAGGVSYSRVSFSNKIINWQFFMNAATVSGSPTQVYFGGSISWTWAFPGLIQTNGVYTDNSGVKHPVYIELQYISATTLIRVSRQDGAAFANGTSNQSFSINVLAEIN